MAKRDVADTRAGCVEFVKDLDVLPREVATDLLVRDPSSRDLDKVVRTEDRGFRSGILIGEEGRETMISISYIL